MKFTVLTLFPEMFTIFQESKVIKRAIHQNRINLEVINFRDYSLNKHRHVDDTPYGGGAGMLIQIEPIDRALQKVCDENSYVVMTSPKAKAITQKDMLRLSQKKHIVFLCGHYEGFDDRISNFVDENVSIGDYILTGGELPAMVIMDSITRLLKGSIREESLQTESYDNGLLEYPQYTKPRIYRGLKVPEILLTGDHAKIASWREEMALYETLKYRPELLKNKKLTNKEKKYLKTLYLKLKKKKFT